MPLHSADVRTYPARLFPASGACDKPLTDITWRIYTPLRKLAKGQQVDKCIYHVERRPEKRTESPRFHRKAVRRWLGRLLLFGTAFTGILSYAVPAFAAAQCTGGQYYYVGGYNTDIISNWNGVERYITAPNDSLPMGQNNSHILFYLDISENTAQCTYDNVCWAQAGFGRGSIDTCSWAANVPYFEQNDPYYGTPYCTYSNQGYSANTFFTLYYNGQHALNGEPIFTAGFLDAAGTWINLGTAALPYDNGYPEALAEMYHNNSGNCPVIAPAGQYQYFGTNGSGGVNSSTWLDAANGTGYPNNWQQAQFPAYAYPYPSPNFPYSVGFLNATSAFKTSGGY